MIYTITFNPSLDYVVFVDKLNKGKIHRTDRYELAAGGKGINVSYILSQLGCENTALGFVAGHTGECLTSLVEEYGVRADFIKLKEGITRINTKIRSDITEDFGYVETDINGAGPVIGEEEVTALLSKLDCLKEGDVVIISGSVPKSVTTTKYSDFVKKCSHLGAIVVVDAVDEYLKAGLLGRPWLIKPNCEEIESFFNITIENESQIIDCAYRLQELGARNVLISLGSDGAILLSENKEIYRTEAPKGEVVNTVGAGDSMVAGFVAGYMQTGKYDKAVRLGTCAGSATAFCTLLAGKDDIMKLLGE